MLHTVSGLLVQQQMIMIWHEAIRHQSYVAAKRRVFLPIGLKLWLRAKVSLEQTEENHEVLFV